MKIFRTTVLCISLAVAPPAAFAAQGMSAQSQTASCHKLLAQIASFVDRKAILSDHVVQQEAHLILDSDVRAQLLSDKNMLNELEVGILYVLNEVVEVCK